MDQDMEADEFFPDKVMSEPEVADEGNNVSTSIDALDDFVKPGEGGDSVVNGEGGSEEMETDEPPSVRDEEMETVEDPVESVNDLEELVKETETEDILSAEEEIAGQNEEETPGGNTETNPTHGNVESEDVKDDNENQNLIDEEAGEGDENEVDSNLDLETENLNKGLNTVTENEEIFKNEDVNEDVLDLEEPLGKTEETEHNDESCGVSSQGEYSSDTNYKENIENLEVSQEGGSEDDENVISQQDSVENTDTVTQEIADKDPGNEKEDVNEEELLGQDSIENHDIAEEREPVEPEEQDENATDDFNTDHDKEEENAGVLEEKADDTENFEGAQSEAAITEGGEETENTEDAESEAEIETKTNLTEISQNIEENTSDKNEVSKEFDKVMEISAGGEMDFTEEKYDESNSYEVQENEKDDSNIYEVKENEAEDEIIDADEDIGAGGTMDITEEKDETNIDEENENNIDNEEGKETNIDEVKDDATEGLQSTADDKEEEMEVESSVVENTEGFIENVKEESEKVENDQNGEETSKEPVADDDTLKPQSEAERDTSEAQPLEHSSALKVEGDSGSANKAVEQAEVQPSGDNSGQSEAVSQAEVTASGDNSRQSEETEDKAEKGSTPDSNETSEAISQPQVKPSAENSSQSEATPTGDNSNQSEETSGKKSPGFDISSVKIKQERKDSTESDKASESDNTAGSHMKIVGVTSAVGVEDKADNSEQASDKGDNADQNGTEKDNLVSDQLRVKQEAQAAALVSATAPEKDDTRNKEVEESKKDEMKKKVNEELRKKIKQESKSKEDEDDDVIAIKEEKKPVQKPKASKIQTCIVCGKVGKCKYNIVRNGDVKHLCDDHCFKRFRSSPTTYLKQAETGTPNQTKSDNQTNNKPTPTPVKPAAPVKATPNQQPSFQAQTQVYKTCTVCQLMNVRTSKPFLNWQGLDFCGEECLGKYQGGLSNNCSYCSGAIFPNNKAKYCCRVGNDVKHFCSANCNNDYVKRMKLCAFCNKDLAQSTDSFMAPVGETFKDFCSQNCLQKFEDKNNKDLEIVGVQKGQKATKVPKGNFICAVCGKVGPVKHEFKLDSKVNRLCSDPCFSAFQYANKLTLNTCDNCGTNLNSENQAPQYVQFEGQQRRFCSFMCVNTFRNTNKKTVPCAWCGSKKSNFDMIERVDANNKYQLFCSLNCLSLYRVNLQATSNQAVTCDQCRKFVPAQYHLTMSDASVRNFCSYGCVMQFQAQFQAPAKQVLKHNTVNNTAGIGRGQAPVQQQTQQQQQTTTRSGRVVTKATKVVETQQQQAGKGRGVKKDADSFPIISNVVSLAPQGTQHGQQQINIKSSTPVTVTNQQQGIKATTTTGNQTVQQQIIIQPPPPKSVKNKSMLCKPFTQTKATSCRPHTQIKEVQTEGKAEPEKLLVPIPVPLYCPTPLAMYSVPTPILIPVPVPIPVPIFIPTTKKNANSILKQIKEIREKIPADPLEAELLMMAEAVAGKDDDSSSSSEEEDNTAPPTKESSTAGATASGGELGEDMLQMALRMASEMTDEPVMDLENSLEPVAVNTEPPPPPPKPVVSSPQSIEEEDEYIPTRARRSRGGNKRQSRNTPNRKNPKRMKVEVTPQYREATPSPPAPAAPPPDANFHLKYTYGVNAFKHWVIQKNNLLEQASKPGHGKNLRTFKTDILQCTADELNFSLCLFVKEVRKPNGEEYAVDSIYYLCLGIQQYLFENGRIDNIFTDFYYERFTEQLNEILTRYEPKLNHAGQLVCRIEEEHLWESKQLGAHSPHVLLNSLVYFNTKYFMLKTSEDHLRLSFTHIMKHWKKTATGRGSGTGPNAGRSVYLRYYCPTPQGKDNQKKKKEEMPVYEQTENLDNPLRCPVKLYEFYLSKCPESIKNRNDMFYLKPESSSVPDSPVWYSNQSINIEHLTKLLNRIRLVREIQEAHLHTRPIYI